MLHCCIVLRVSMCRSFGFCALEFAHSLLLEAPASQTGQNTKSAALPWHAEEMALPHSMHTTDPPRTAGSARNPTRCPTPYRRRHSASLHACAHQGALSWGARRSLPCPDRRRLPPATRPAACLPHTLPHLHQHTRTIHTPTNALPCCPCAGATHPQRQHTNTPTRQHQRVRQAARTASTRRLSWRPTC